MFTPRNAGCSNHYDLKCKWGLGIFTEKQVKYNFFHLRSIELWYCTNNFSISCFRVWVWWRGVSIWTTSIAQIPMIVIGPYTCIGLRQKWQATIHVKYLPFRMTWQERKGWLYLVCICGTISRYIRYIIASFYMIHIYHFVFWVWFYGLCVYKTITHLYRTYFQGTLNTR